MKTLRLSEERQQLFLEALAESGDVAAAAAAAGTTSEGAEELRAIDAEFAAGWNRALSAVADKLERVARARALDGLLEPVVSDGKVVRDDKGQPLVVRRYADDILLAMLKAHRPEKFNDWKLISQAIYPRWVKWLTITFLAAISLSALGDLLLRITQIRH
jgi:hypothetical protein